MLDVLRHRRLRLLHLLLPLLVGLAVFGTSLASALTEVHMLAHSQVGADVHDHDDQALDFAADAKDSTGALLHALVHCMDCHGHGGVLPGMMPPWTLPMPQPVHDGAGQVAQRAQQPAESLFRPPIAV